MASQTSRVLGPVLLSRVTVNEPNQVPLLLPHHSREHLPLGLPHSPSLPFGLRTAGAKLWPAKFWTAASRACSGPLSRPASSRPVSPKVDQQRQPIIDFASGVGAFARSFLPGERRQLLLLRLSLSFSPVGIRAWRLWEQQARKQRAHYVAASRCARMCSAALPLSRISSVRPCPPFSASLPPPPHF